jgi:hypothetical protein
MLTDTKHGENCMHAWGYFYCPFRKCIGTTKPTAEDSWYCPRFKPNETRRPCVTCGNMVEVPGAAEALRTKLAGEPDARGEVRGYDYPGDTESDTESVPEPTSCEPPRPAKKRKNEEKPVALRWSDREKRLVVRYGLYSK